MMMVTREYKILGRVQGVGFRYFVREKATQYKINGFVRNMYDRSVFAIAQGEVENLYLFEQAINNGSALSRVTEVIKSEIKGSEIYGNFEIRY